MTWTDEALLPVMMLVVLHRAWIAIESFVEEFKIGVKTEFMEVRRMR